MVYLSGIFCGEIQPNGPKTQMLQIVLAVQEIQFFAVQQNAPAGITILNDREFRACLVYQLDRCQVAGAAAGSALYQTVFRYH